MCDHEGHVHHEEPRAPLATPPWIAALVAVSGLLLCLLVMAAQLRWASG